MIAQSGQKSNRPVAIQDLLLIALSTVVIVLSQMQRGPARQVVELRTATGSLQKYSLDVDDPRLAKIRSDSKVRSTSKGPPPHASRALLQWQAEVAGFYADLTDPFVVLGQGSSGHKPADALVLPASFIESESSAAREASSLQAQHRYWLKVRDDAVAALATAEAQLAQQHSLRELDGTRSPLVLGPVVKGGYSFGSMLLAAVIGLCAASGLAWWTYTCPAIRLEAEVSGVSPQPPRMNNTGQLRLVIPPDWVRIHQPAAVIARRIVYAAIVITALGCVAT